MQHVHIESYEYADLLLSKKLNTYSGIFSFFKQYAIFIIFFVLLLLSFDVLLQKWGNINTQILKEYFFVSFLIGSTLFFYDLILYYKLVHHLLNKSFPLLVYSGPSLFFKSISEQKKIIYQARKKYGKKLPYLIFFHFFKKDKETNIELIINFTFLLQYRKVFLENKNPFRFLSTLMAYETTRGFLLVFLLIFFNDRALLTSYSGLNLLFAISVITLWLVLSIKNYINLNHQRVEEKIRSKGETVIGRENLFHNLDTFLQIDQYDGDSLETLIPSEQFKSNTDEENSKKEVFQRYIIEFFAFVLYVAFVTILTDIINVPSIDISDISLKNLRTH